ncbi:(Fe-S)-binding protein, partial [bacterium]|nr:(Fe-S)-binding protein [bacterium]
MEAIQPKPISDKFKEIIKKADMNACLTCGTCIAGCPSSGIDDME